MNLRHPLWSVAALLLAGSAGAILWWRHPPLATGDWATGPPPHPWAAWQRQERVWAQTGGPGIAYAYRPLEEISRELAVAVVVGEDLGFFSHSGVDPRAIWEAVRQWFGGRRLRGASTLSQQLARILFLSNDRTLARKVREARLAWWLDRELGKRRVLELYLNVVEFGPGVYGAEAAARRYYGCGAHQLDATRAAGLAAAIPSPAVDNPATRSPRWRAREEIIAGRMTRVAWLWELLAAKGAGRLVKSGEPH